MARFEPHSAALERFWKASDQLSGYQKLLKDIEALPATGTRSFKATRARVLQAFGRRFGDRTTAAEAE
jgi:hypothetical protein